VSRVGHWNMAHYENLPIYKKAFELAVYIEQVVKGFSRYHKYTIGSDLRNLSRNLAVLVIKANSIKDKLPALTELRDKSEELKLTIMKCEFQQWQCQQQ